MRAKCEMNLEMARILSQDKAIQAGWTTSVHCAYYAVFQFMKYILAEKANPKISYESQDSHMGDDSHKYILEEIKNRISAPTEARQLRDRIRNLKQQRVLADYKRKVFDQTESLDCYNEADTIIRKISKLLSA